MLLIIRTNGLITTDTTEIYYNYGNVGIGTNDPTNKLHIRNDATNTTALTIQNNFVVSSITATPTTTGTTGIYTYMVFTYTTDNTGAGQSLYTINVPATGVVCDILLVGGGGGGSGTVGGGGGGGVLIFARNAILNGTYTIKVGRGGTGGSYGQGTKGNRSSI